MIMELHALPMTIMELCVLPMIQMVELHVLQDILIKIVKRARINKIVNVISYMY